MGIKKIINYDTYLRRPYVNAFIETTASKKLSVWTECYTIDGLGVLGKRVYANTSFHIP